MTTNNTERYEHIIISGQPFERGLSYGKQTKSKIITNINYYKEPGVLPDWDIVQKYIRDNYLKSIEKYYPSGLLEIKGIAVGAGVPVEDIIVLNARYELLGWKKILGLVNGVERQSGDCTGGICLPKATKSGDVLLGQTWDNYQRVLDDDIAVLLEVRPDPSERIASFFMLSEAGQLGRTGMNAKGLGLLAMTMFSTDDNLQTNNKNGYLPIDLLRRIFIESPTFSVGIRRITSAPRNSSLNMIVATAEGEGLSIELTPKQFYISYPSIKKDIYTHSNHFKSESFLAKESIRDAIRGGSSFYRDRQLERRLLKSWPNIDENSFENAFKDHLGYPESLCGHKAEEGNECISNLPDYCTVAAVIYNLNRRSIKLCKGHPCKRNFVEYQLLPSLY